MFKNKTETMTNQGKNLEWILEKVKAIPELPHTTEITLEQAAQFFETTIHAVKNILLWNREEFEEECYIRVLRGDELKEFKNLCKNQVNFNHTPSLTLLSRRGLLRMGMLLKRSAVAKSVRHYILNVEEISEKERLKLQADYTVKERRKNALRTAIEERYPTLADRQYQLYTDLATHVLDLKESFLTQAQNEAFTETCNVIATFIKLGCDYDFIEEQLIKSSERLKKNLEVRANGR